MGTIFVSFTKEIRWSWFPCKAIHQTLQWQAKGQWNSWNICARRTQIYSCVHSPASEILASLIPLLITQLKEELWKHLVTISFNNIDELIARASNLEWEFVTRPNSNQLANEKITQKNLNQWRKKSTLPRWKRRTRTNLRHVSIVQNVTITEIAPS